MKATLLGLSLESSVVVMSVAIAVHWRVRGTLSCDYFCVCAHANRAMRALCRSLRSSFVMYATGAGGGEDEDEDEGDTGGPLVGKQQRRGHVRAHSRALAGTWHSVV